MAKSPRPAANRNGSRASKARAYGMKLRQGSDAILVGLTLFSQTTHRLPGGQGGAPGPNPAAPCGGSCDSEARTPWQAKVVSDEFAAWTTIVVSRQALKPRVAAWRNGERSRRTKQEVGH